MYTYKNKTDQDFTLVGFGVVKANQTFQSKLVIENPNIEFVSSDGAAGVVGTESPQPNAVTDAQKVSDSTPLSNPQETK